MEAVTIDLTVGYHTPTMLPASKTKTRFYGTENKESTNEETM